MAKTINRKYRVFLIEVNPHPQATLLSEVAEDADYDKSADAEKERNRLAGENIGNAYIALPVYPRKDGTWGLAAKSAQAVTTHRILDA